MTVPIPGTSSIEHFEENLNTAQLELRKEELDSLDALSGS
jgi:aryl-alcohol dehydrogenase-like predicted oxidoreductase